MKKQNAILIIEHTYERTALFVLSLMVVGLVCAYMYLVSASVLHVMARTEAVAHEASMKGDIGTAEQQYLELALSVTLDSESTLALVPLAPASYVYRAVEETPNLASNIR